MPKETIEDRAEKSLERKEIQLDKFGHAIKGHPTIPKKGGQDCNYLNHIIANKVKEMLEKE